ncbi:hypothetical protein GCM10023259_015540 [Thermocatellispora tengchongensis]
MARNAVGCSPISLRILVVIRRSSSDSQAGPQAAAGWPYRYRLVSYPNVDTHFRPVV